MNQIELARQWAAAPIGYRKAASLFYDGTTIYSYSRKFPLAKIVDPENAIVTSCHCPSVTTKRHLNLVRRVLEHASYVVTVGPLC